MQAGDHIGLPGVVILHPGEECSLIEAFTKADRKDLADKETAEMLVLQAYLPARLSADEITAAVGTLVQGLVAELGRPLTGADMGKVMGAAKAQFAGKADMGQVSAAIKAALAG